MNAIDSHQTKLEEKKFFCLFFCPEEKRSIDNNCYIVGNLEPEIKSAGHQTLSLPLTS